MQPLTTTSLVIAAFLAIAGIASAPQACAEEAGQAPVELIETSTDDLISAIEAARSYFDQDPERFYAQVLGILDPVIDFKSFSRSVMAVHYKRASEDQRERFVTNFRGALVRTYGKALLEFNNEKIEVMADERQSSKPDRKNVRMEVTSGSGQVYPVIYSMRYSDEKGWRIRNIIVNGINIGLTYRNQFSSAMNNSDLDSVINDWATTVANVDPVAGEEAAGSAAPSPPDVSKS
jgi:phospholipid transport system substrate-binding protein